MATKEFDEDSEPRPTIEGVVYQMLHQARLMEAHSPDIAKALKAGTLDFWERPSGERKSVQSTLRTQLKFLSYPVIREILGDDDLED